MATDLCPSCGQSTRYVRFGILLPRVKCEIVDAIKAAGDLGISTKDILHKLYRERQPVLASTIKAHVWQINEKLAETKYSIISDRRRWFLHKGR
jgi:hypothetical protein